MRKRFLIAASLLASTAASGQGINPIMPPTNWLIQVLDPAFANPSNLYTTPAKLLTGGVINVANGSVAAPSIAPLNSPTTGFSFPSAGTMAFSAAGVNKLDYGVSSGGAWSVNAVLTMGTNNFFGNNVAFAGSITNTGITLDTGLTDATVCVATTTGGGGVVGAYYKGTGTAGICLGTSSSRYKHDIVDLNVGLEQIMKLRPVEYRLNSDHGGTDKPLYGFIAEDGIGVLPKLIGLDDQERPNTMDYLGIVPVLVRAMQQQQTRIDALEEKAR